MKLPIAAALVLAAVPAHAAQDRYAGYYSRDCGRGLVCDLRIERAGRDRWKIAFAAADPRDPSNRAVCTFSTTAAIGEAAMGPMAVSGIPVGRVRGARSASSTSATGGCRGRRRGRRARGSRRRASTERSVTDPVVVRSPEVMGGAAVFRGTRVSTGVLFENLSDGLSLGEILDAYLTLDREDCERAILEAGRLIAAAAPQVDYLSQRASRVDSATATAEAWAILDNVPDVPPARDDLPK